MIEETVPPAMGDAAERVRVMLARARQAGLGEYVGAVLDDEDLRAIHAVLDRITIAERNAQTAARENEQTRLLLEAARESMARDARRLAAADRDLLEAERIGLEATMKHNTAQSRVTALEAALRKMYEASNGMYARLLLNGTVGRELAKLGKDPSKGRNAEETMTRFIEPYEAALPAVNALLADGAGEEASDGTD